MTKVDLNPPTGDDKKEPQKGGCAAAISAAIGVGVLIYAIYILCTL